MAHTITITISLDRQYGTPDTAEAAITLLYEDVDKIGIRTARRGGELAQRVALWVASIIDAELETL